jgi:hypothetical protein
LTGDNILIKTFENHKGKYSDKWSSYLEIYWHLFSPIRESESDILEIGIQNGGSLEIWAKFFPNSKKIMGFDIHPKCRNLEFLDSRIEVYVEDAAEKSALTLLRGASDSLGGGCD